MDVDSEELGRNYANTFGVHGDARLSLEALLAEVSKLAPARADRSAEVAAERAQREEARISVEPQESFLAAVRSALPDDGILIAGMTQLGYYSRAYFPVYEPRTFITSSYSGNLGYAYPTALGGQGGPARQGRGWRCLATAASCTTRRRWRRRCSTASTPWWWWFNDNAYGNVLRDQRNRFAGRTIGADLHNPDFMKLADAYGMNGVRVETPDGLETALKQCLAHDGPSLIEVPVGPMPTPFERLG